MWDGKLGIQGLRQVNVRIGGQEIFFFSFKVREFGLIDEVGILRVRTKLSGKNSIRFNLLTSSR